MKTSVGRHIQGRRLRALIPAARVAVLNMPFDLEALQRQARPTISRRRTQSNQLFMIIHPAWVNGTQRRAGRFTGKENGAFMDPFSASGRRQRAKLPYEGGVTGTYCPTL